MDRGEYEAMIRRCAPDTDDVFAMYNICDLAVKAFKTDVMTTR